MRLEGKLNPEQMEAVLHTEGPLLILAGAGSGKTRVITYRIAHMIDQGISPFNILAITFTNKAAEEMRNRVDDLVGFGADSIWVATFHSTCARILRRHIDILGYDTNFTIYDTDDTKKIVTNILKKNNLDPKKFPPKAILSVISTCKNEMVSVEEYASTATEEFEKNTALVYREYQKALFDNNALDFDDLLLLTVELFKKSPEVLENFRNRFRYILVDEYQDTNTVQFSFIKMLADKYRNLCVVGDDDQSIYRFRGANIRNILDFEKNYPDALVVKLEQNYRSTENILNSANAVIAHNKNRKDKTLWSQNGAGTKVHFRDFDNSRDEAQFVVDDIYTKVRRRDCMKKDCAILYRTNQQSRELEETLLRENMPYNIVGGQNFYGRREIKDILAYLKTIANGNDNLNVERIINVPKRGIGDTSLGKARAYAENNEISLFEALLHADRIPTLGKTASKMKDFAADICIFRERIAENEFEDLPELIGELIEKIGYSDYLFETEEEEDAKDRIANVDELISKAAYFEEKYAQENPEAEHGPTLQEFLNDVSLVADIDDVNTDADRILLMTLHAAKGLEFNHVYIVGMEDGLFPGDRAIVSASYEDMEEERRLAYVGITRAKEDLTLTACHSRMVRGMWSNYPISRFVREIPSELLDSSMKIAKASVDSIPTVEQSAFKPNRLYAGYTNKMVNKKSESSDNNGVDLSKKPYGTTGLLKGVNYSKPKAVAKPVANINPGLSGLTKGSDLTGETNYKKGDRVSHIKFGEGVITNIDNSGKSTYITIEFNDYGQRILDSRFAKLNLI